MEEVELVNDEQLLGKSLFTHKTGQPLRNPVDFRRVHRADLAHMDLVRLEPPLRIQRKSDMGEAKELLIDLRLGQEVGSSRL